MQSAGQQTIRGVGRWEGSRLAREKQPLSVRPGRSERGGGERIVLPEGSSPVTAYVCPVWSWHWRRERATDCRPRYYM